MKTNEIHSISIRTMYSICIYYQSTVCVISVVIGILYSIQLLDNIKLLMVHIGRIMKYTPRSQKFGGQCHCDNTV